MSSHISLDFAPPTERRPQPPKQPRTATRPAGAVRSGSGNSTIQQSRVSSSTQSAAPAVNKSSEWSTTTARSTVNHAIAKAPQIAAQQLEEQKLQSTQQLHAAVSRMKSPTRDPNMLRASMESKYKLNAASETAELAAETQRMEERLAALKIAMTEQRNKRQQVQRTAEGHLWKNADVKSKGINNAQSQSSAGSSSYIQSVIAKVKQQQMNADLAAEKAASFYSQPQVPSYYAPPVGTMQNNKASTLQSTIPRATIQPAPVALLTLPIAAASVTSDSPTGLQTSSPPNTSQMTTSSLLDGDYDEDENRNAFAEARQQFLAELNQPAEAKHSIARTDEPASVAPGSLLDGVDFDEAASRREFELAREQFLASLPTKPLTPVLQRPASRAAATTTTNSSQPSTTTTAAERKSCYNCYKLFYSDRGISVDDSKHMCSADCHQEYQNNLRQACASDYQCTAMIRRQDGVNLDDGRLVCKTCVARKRLDDAAKSRRTVAAVADPTPAADTPAEDIRMHTPTPPALHTASLRSATPPSSTSTPPQPAEPVSASVTDSCTIAPTPRQSAEQPVVVAVRPATASAQRNIAAPVVEFPSDDDD